MSKEVKIFCTRASQYLGKKIAENYGKPLAEIALEEYSDGEFKPSFEESVRGCRAFIIGSTFPPQDNLMELLLLIDAAKRASAQRITVVVPYYGWARQDRKDKPRVPIAAKLVASLIATAGATRLMTMDLHADQIQGFFEIPVDHLYSSSIFLPYIKSLGIQDLVIASPDMGGAKRAHSYAKFLDCDVVICYKERKRANEVGKMMLIGDVKGKNAIVVDDMVDTAGTLTKAADMIAEKGVRSVSAVCTHPLLSGAAMERIAHSALAQLIVTDTVPIQTASSKIKVLSCAPLFAQVMKSVHNYTSISPNFII